MMMIRLFIALEIPEKIISAVLGERDKAMGSEKNIHWEPKEKLHITLKFLGDTDEEKLKNIYAALKSLTSKQKTIGLAISKFGVFRKGGEPKILWFGMKENKNLTNFVNEIEESLCKFGYPKENREFKPHVTLLRFRGYEDSIKILNLLGVKLPALIFEAEKVLLIRSELKQTGSVYSTIKSFTLEK